jgi:hypothetical protein
MAWVNQMKWVLIEAGDQIYFRIVVIEKRPKLPTLLNTLSTTSCDINLRDLLRISFVGNLLWYIRPSAHVRHFCLCFACNLSELNRANKEFNEALDYLQYIFLWPLLPSVVIVIVIVFILPRQQ